MKCLLGELLGRPGQPSGCVGRDGHEHRRGLDRDEVADRASEARGAMALLGEPDRDAPEGSAVRGVKVLYAQRGSDADARIESLVEASTDPRGLTVVTSDRRLAFAVRTQGATVVRSGDFRKQLDRILESTPNVEDGEQDEVGDVNSWLRYFGSLPEDDEE